MLLDVLNINYFIVLLEAIIVATFSPKCSRQFLLITAVQLVLLLGLRDLSVGIDTRTYSEMFFTVLNGGRVSHIEIGNQILIWLATRISQEPTAMYLIYALLTVSCIDCFIAQRSRNIAFSVVMYTGFMFYYWAFNGMRQALAMSIGLIAVHYLLNNKTWKFVLFLLLAISIHISAIVLFVCWFIRTSKIRINRNWIMWVTIVSVACVLFGRQLIVLLVRIVPQYSGYLSSSFAGIGNLLHPLLYLALFYFICWLKTSSASENDSFLLVLLAIGVIVYFISIRVQIVNRMTYYFTIPIIVLLPNIVAGMPAGKNKLFTKALLYAGISCYEVMLIMRNAQGIVPYKFFWNT